MPDEAGEPKYATAQWLRGGTNEILHGVLARGGLRGASTKNCGRWPAANTRRRRERPGIQRALPVVSLPMWLIWRLCRPMRWHCHERIAELEHPWVVHADAAVQRGRRRHQASRSVAQVRPKVRSDLSLLIWSTSGWPWTSHRPRSPRRRDRARRCSGEVWRPRQRPMPSWLLPLGLRRLSKHVECGQWCAACVDRAGR